MKKHVLVNAYYSVNLGDDLFLKVLFDRYPDVNWDLFTSKEEYTTIFKSYPNVNILKSLHGTLGRRSFNLFSKINNTLLKYYKYDALVVIGGSIFMQHPEWEKQLKDRTLLPALFQQRNKKSFIIGANFGPYTDERFLQQHKSFFSLFDDICFRDRYSYELFQELDNVRHAPDVVFQLDTGTPVATTHIKYAGFSLMNIGSRKSLSKYGDAYLLKMSELAKAYIGFGYKVRLFSFCESEGDARAVQQLLEELSDVRDEIEAVYYQGDIDMFLEKFKSCDIVVGTRFHSIILAIKFRKRMFPIVYSEKTYNVLKDLGLDQHYCRIQDIHQWNVKEAIRATLSQEASAPELMGAEQQFEKLDRFLERTAARKVWDKLG